jgi:hypothetical protein
MQQLGFIRYTGLFAVYLSIYKTHDCWNALNVSPALYLL